MPTIKMPIWMRSEYVTIRSTPFSLSEIRGLRSYPRSMGGQPPTVTGSTTETVAYLFAKIKQFRQNTTPGVVFRTRLGSFFTFFE